MSDRRQAHIHNDRQSADNYVSEDSSNVAEDKAQAFTKITIVMPVHNEEDNIKNVVSDVLGV